MTTTLTSATNVTDVLKQVYEPVINNNIVTESEVWDLFTMEEGFKVIEGPDGKQINLAHMFSGGGGFSFMSESSYIPTATDPIIKQSSLNIKQAAIAVEISGQVMRRVKSGPAAFLDWAQEILPLKVERLVFHQDRALVGTGTGIASRIIGTPTTAAVSLQANYGIASLEGSEFSFMLGDSIRVGPNADGSALRTGAAVINGLNYDNPSVSIDAVPASAAANDYIFLGDANVNGAGIETMGLEGIVDDGTNVAVFQNLSRSVYTGLNAQIIDAVTANSGVYAGALSEDILDFADRRSHERGMGKPDVIASSRSALSSFWKSLKDDRRINDPAGNYHGGKNELTMILGARTLTLKPCRKIPSSRCYLLQRDTLRMFRLGAGRWDDTPGSVWDRVIDSTGRKDAFWAVFIHEYNVASGAPNKNVKIKSLAAA